MEKQFVPYELALKLKELGFNEECIAYYYGVGKDLYFWNVPEGLRGGRNTTDFKESLPQLPENNCTAPLWQQTFDWFREKHNLNTHIYKCCKINNYFGYDIFHLLEFKTLKISTDSYTTYEEARYACLEKLIELIEK